MTTEKKQKPPFEPPEIIPDQLVVPDNTIFLIPDDNAFSNPPHIVKAGKTRDWWPPFFYNCLPIVFGNQHGFLMLATYDFVVRWDGDLDITGVLIHPLEPIPFLNFIMLDSHFGSGILTVQSRYSFRTPRGVNMIVKEPPNYPVHGLSWLNAVVETDNLRRDFTFNIKITQPHMDIYIAKGTPLGCILPYPRYFLDRYKIEELTEPVRRNEEQQTARYFGKERNDHDEGQPRKRYMEGIDIYNLKFEEHQKSLDMGAWWNSERSSTDGKDKAAAVVADVHAEQRFQGQHEMKANEEEAVKRCPIHFALPKSGEAQALASAKQDNLASVGNQNESQNKKPWWAFWKGDPHPSNGEPNAHSSSNTSTTPVSNAGPQAEEEDWEEEEDSGPLDILQTGGSITVSAAYPTSTDQFSEIVELNADLPDNTVTLFLPPNYDKTLLPVKADRLRHWWEQDNKTRDHARFCLPLTMAAGVGWYILSPATFTVEWDGDDEHDATVEVIDASSHAIVDTHSAHGSFTVQAQFVPRTKRPGDYVYVKGVANQYRLSYYPLEAMIEAWWNPGNFGLVCMLSRAGKFTIKKGDPIAQMLVVNSQQALYELGTRDGYPPHWQEWDKKRRDPSYNGRGLDYFKGLWPDGKQVCPHFKNWSKQDSPENLVPNEASGDTAYPLFDQKTDGPLLESAKTIEVDTDAGKIHLILDPELAPITATQLFKLLRSGVFNGTPFVRHEPGFLVQTAVAEEKAGGYTLMTAKAKSLLRRLPLEIEAQTRGDVLHKKWVIGMGRGDEVNSEAVTSFSIFLGDAPHLNGKYTIFGRIVPDTVTIATLDRISSKFPTHTVIKSAREI